MKTTQNDMILRHLQDYSSITTWEAIQEYGVTRLSARISDIKDMGYIITDEWVSTPNRYGEMISFKKYSLEM